MGIGLSQHNTRCSNSTDESGKELIGMKSAIESETELIHIRLIVSAATVVGTLYKCLEITDGGVYPFQITNLIFRGFDHYIFQAGIACVSIALDC